MLIAMSTSVFFFYYYSTLWSHIQKKKKKKKKKKLKALISAIFFNFTNNSKFYCFRKCPGLQSYARHKSNPWNLSRPSWAILELIPKTIGNRKRDCAWGCASVKKLKKNQLLSTNHHQAKQIGVLMICAQQLIFLQFFNTRASSRTISFSISNSFWY